MIVRTVIVNCVIVNSVVVNSVIVNSNLEMGTGNGPLFFSRNIALSAKPGILEFVYIFYKLYIDYVLYKVYNI